jgi:SAM-dependent methyltransferase
MHLTMLRQLHNAHVHSRRVRVLAGHLCDLIPRGARVLDVGAGDGLLASQVLAIRTDLEWVALDTLARPATHIPVEIFDGKRLPFADEQFDAVLFIDVLHHTDNQMSLLREAVRVSRDSIVIKDHLREGFCAGPTLRLMDWWGIRAGASTCPTIIGAVLSGLPRNGNCASNPRSGVRRWGCIPGGRTFGSDALCISSRDSAFRRLP